MIVDDRPRGPLRVFTTPRTTLAPGSSAEVGFTSMPEPACFAVALDVPPAGELLLQAVTLGPDKHLLAFEGNGLDCRGGMRWHFDKRDCNPTRAACGWYNPTGASLVIPNVALWVADEDSDRAPYVESQKRTP